MGDGTKISWTNATWNPIRGCSRVSEGCRHCYAERVAARFSGPGMPYEGLIKFGKPSSVRDPRWNGTVRVVAEHLADPLRWRRPRRVFVNSMSDLFHESLTNEQIAAVFGVMAAAAQHTFQVLTKRAKRMREWFRWIDNGPTRAQPPIAAMNAALDVLPDGTRLTVKAPAGGPDKGWPLPNVHIGVSVENQAAADERIPELLRTPAAVRWISAEPLIGPVDLAAASPNARSLVEDLDWIVMGAESGHGARAADPAWFRVLAEQCRSARVPVFFKQAMAGGGVTAGPGSIAKRGGLIGLPLLDGASLVEFP